jgi:hypothetical protein
MVSGPIGRSSLQLDRYRHIVLIAGGIGITALAPVFAAVAAGLPVGPVPGPLERALGCFRVRPTQLYRGLHLSLSLMWTVRAARCPTHPPFFSSTTSAFFISLSRPIHIDVNSCEKRHFAIHFSLH